MDYKNIIPTFILGVGIALTLGIFINILNSENLVPILKIFENELIVALFIFSLGISMGYYTGLLFNNDAKGVKYAFVGFFGTIILFIVFNLSPFEFNKALLFIGFIIPLCVQFSSYLNKTPILNFSATFARYIFNIFLINYMSVNYFVPKINIIFNFNLDILSYVLIFLMSIMPLVLTPKSLKI